MAKGLTLPTKDAEARFEAEMTRMVRAPYCDPGPGGFYTERERERDRQREERGEEKQVRTSERAREKEEKEKKNITTRR